MKSKLLGVAIFVLTAATIILFPHYQSKAKSGSSDDMVAGQSKKIEVVFVLDTTGSMGGMIQAAKDKIWSIATSMASAKPAPEIKIGLVAFRDRGDRYVTKVVDLSSDLDSVYAQLMQLRARGGGDGPESVNQALYEAIHSVSWAQEPGTYQTVFLVGDAPPHMDYQDDVKYPATLEVAKKRGIVINTIQCGRSSHTRKKWQHIAQLGLGRYFQVGQSGDAVAIATPFDKELAALSRKLDATRMYFGSREEKQKLQAKLKATDELHKQSSVESRARRATFNATASGEPNAFGGNDLVEAVTKGDVDLKSIERDHLPASLQALSAPEQETVIKETGQRRDALKREIRELADQRAAYLRNKVEQIGGASESLDDRIYGAVRAQAGKKGFRYNESAPAY